MRKGLFIILFGLIGNLTSAQQDMVFGSARISAFAGISSPLLSAEGLWSNPAGIGDLGNLSILAFADNRFGVSGLGSQAISVGIPIGDGGLGLNYGSFGFDTYRESRLGASFGMQISQGSRLGLRLNWYRLGVEDIFRNKLSADIGGLFPLGKTLRLGFLVSNPFDFLESSQSEVDLPAQIRIGLAYAVSKELMLMTEFDKVADRKENMRFALEYQFHQRVCARWGYSLQPGLFSFGIGVKLGSLRLDFAASSHQYLGLSPQFSALWRLNAKEE